MTDEEYAEYAPIRTLNDRFRRAPEPSAIILSRRVSELPPDVLEELLQAVRSDDHFDEAEDDLSYLKHNMGYVEVRGQRYVWDIQCWTADGTVDSEGDSADDLRGLCISHSRELEPAMFRPNMPLSNSVSTSMTLYAVRKIENRAAVGLVWAPDLESARWMVDSEFDVTECEYLEITDRNMIIWPDEPAAFAMGTIEGPVAASDARDAGKIDIAPQVEAAFEQRRRRWTSTMSIAGGGSLMDLLWGATETTGWKPLDPTGECEREVREALRRKGRLVELE